MNEIRFHVIALKELSVSLSLSESYPTKPPCILFLPLPPPYPSNAPFFHTMYVIQTMELRKEMTRISHFLQFSTKANIQSAKRQNTSLWLLLSLSECSQKTRFVPMSNMCRAPFHFSFCHIYDNLQRKWTNNPEWWWKYFFSLTHCQFSLMALLSTSYYLNEGKPNEWKIQK